MKKVIMLATYFPPAGGISTFRITKFVKYVPKFNWKPVVVTVKEECYIESNFLIDHTLVKDLNKDLIIYRTGIAKEPTFLNSLRKGLPTRWLKPLFASIGEIIKKERPQLLFATGDPFFPLLVAPFVKWRYGIKYVIDLRDPWKLAIVDNPPKGLKGKFFVPINNFLEPIVLNRASKVVVVSEKMAQQYREEYPNRPADDFVVIPNGFDPDDYDSIPPAIFDQFTISYAGKFLTGKSFRNPTHFFKAIKILKKEGIHISFNYIGEVNPSIHKLVEEIGIEDQFVSVGYLSYHDTIANMKGSNALILIGSGQETEQTGKVFDYLGCKRPILALAGKKGGIADVVNGIEDITLIENDSPQLIADSIREIYKKHKVNIPVERLNIAKYLRSNLAGELTKVFDVVLSDQ